ncbi:TRAP transporter substrate-binding protein [Brevibacillus choshinensis]|uniref:TRAP transporter substrate-binding protein n=1 Tax=Brevibacillus choshinensis TaxID=54911 RepID=UPI002E1B0E50|nr:TRAP transporter substrate-binding protein [Brevibacillus choshinensis]
MKKRIFTLLCFASLALSLVVTACGSKADAPPAGASAQGGNNSSATYTFKYAHVAQPTHIANKVAEKFKQELDTRSNGRMKLDIFPASQLGSEKDMYQQIQAGAIDFGSITNAYLSTRSESFNGWFMPFLFSDLESATKSVQTEASQNMLKELGKQGTIGVGYVFSGNRHILMKDGAIQSPEQLQGKKIRIIGSPAIQDFWKAVGAGPTPMPLPEVYTALQTGVIDGIDIDLDALVTQKYYEIAKDLTLTNHMTFPSVALISKSTYDKLPTDDQKIVTDAFASAIIWGLTESITMEKNNLEELKKQGVNVMELTKKDTFIPISEELYKQYGEKNGIIKDFITANKK